MISEKCSKLSAKMFLKFAKTIFSKSLELYTSVRQKYLFLVAKSTYLYSLKVLMNSC